MSTKGGGNYDVSKTKIPGKEILSYAVSSGGGNVITTLVGSYYSAYLTDSVGVAVAAVGTMMVICRVIDAITNIIMGGIVDRTHTKWGKARPWLLISAPLVMISLILAFAVPTGWAENSKVIYMYLTYIFMNCICFTSYMIPDTALCSRMSLDTYERGKLTSANQIANQLFGLAVSLSIVPLSSSLGWTATAAIYGVMAMAGILIGFFGTVERVGLSDEGTQAKVETTPLSVSLPSLFKNKYFYFLLLFFIMQLAQASGPNSMIYYYTKEIVGDTGAIAVLSTTAMIPAMIMNFFIPSITRKFGRQRCLLVATAITILCFGACSLCGGNMTALMVILVCKGFSAGFIFACGFAMAADVVDYGGWKFGVRSDGLINSAVSFGQVFGLGIGPAIANWILGYAGYDGLAASQTQSALNAINFNYGWLGAIFAGLMFVFTLFLNMDKFSDQMQADLVERRRNK